MDVKSRGRLSQLPNPKKKNPPVAIVSTFDSSIEKPTRCWGTLYGVACASMARLASAK